jgi:3-hydroxyacyl-CoA dehydrogenase
MALCQEGADPLKVNKALTDFGFPVGGISLVDEVGIDVAKHVVANLCGAQPKFLGVRMDGANLEMIDKFVENGLHGRKSGKGFFNYSNAKGPKTINETASALLKEYRHPTKDASKLDAEQMLDRMVSRFLSEAVHCLQSGVIASPRDGDIGAVFGIGFPPFLGGPFMYIDRVGAGTVVDKMKTLQAEHGDQFEPPQMLVDMAKSGKLFHP